MKTRSSKLVRFLSVLCLALAGAMGCRTPTKMALIPSGSFMMGDSLDGDVNALPLHTNQVSMFYMDRYEVTKALWDEIYIWATNHGYAFDHRGSWDSGVNYSKGPNHPVIFINWYDAVKWCNARSEKQNRTPAYYTSAGQTNVYRSGQVDVRNDWVRWTAGYRLPTEAEWEKAARGGASGHRYPWVDVDTVTHSRANYKSSTDYPYDMSSTCGFHPNFNDGVQPYTGPVGYFAPNGYGLYDMAGNVYEWCWDWGGYYGSAVQTDPRGPTTGVDRVARGGCWINSAFNCRPAYRGSGKPNGRDFRIGLRCVLAPGQPQSAR